MNLNKQIFYQYKNLNIYPKNFYLMFLVEAKDECLLIDHVKYEMNHTLTK